MERESVAVRRMESLPRTEAVVGAAVACAALLGGMLLGADADAKKKGKGGGGAVASETSQAAIVDAGSIPIRGGKGKVVVRAMSGGKIAGVLAQGKGRSLKLSDAGKTLISGCTVESLSTKSSSKGKRGKKRSRVRGSALELDLAVCSVGSENPASKPYKGPPLDTTASDRCDFMDPAVCLQPWPNDYFTIADGATDTGRRVNLNLQSMPRNISGTPVDPTDINRADGWSPGNMIVVKVPGLETKQAVANSNLPPVNNTRKWDDEGVGAVVIDADTGDRHPIFAEVDANPSNAADVNLIIRPLRNFEEGHRYIVALRNLRNAQNQPISPPMPFRVYRDRLITQQGPVEARRATMEAMFGTLQSNGYARSNLYMAWDFTVASEDSLTGRALDMRDDALLRLGDTAPGGPIDGLGDSTPGDGVMDGDAPDFTITSTSDPDGAGPILRQVNGTLTNVPCYLNNLCKAGSQFSFAPGSDDPTLDPTTFADDDESGNTGVQFRCIIPNSVDSGTEVAPAKPGTYGHGLLGSFTQVNGQGALANQNNSVWCATDWAGFAGPDLGAGVIPAMVDLSNFAKLVDRMQQGFVNFLYLGRAMAHQDGFNTDDAFKVDADESTTLDADEAVIENNDELYFEGISQGAIMGGALTALSPDFTRSVLNVPGMNYSTLLRRSVDTSEYVEMAGVGLYNNYTSLRERPLIFSVMQLLWDRGEANGYAHHMTDDPLANTPAHQVLLQPAYGDHQVSNLTAEIEARTIGAKIHAPALDPNRHWEANPFMGIDPIDFGSIAAPTPYTGSALVYYDGGPLGFAGVNGCGTATPPNENVPPVSTALYGCDPHGYPRRSPDGLEHVETFLQPNGFILPCTDPGPVARPCYANGWTGP